MRGFAAADGARMRSAARSGSARVTMRTICISPLVVELGLGLWFNVRVLQLLALELQRLLNLARRRLCCGAWTCVRAIDRLEALRQLAQRLGGGVRGGGGWAGGL